MRNTDKWYPNLTSLIGSHYIPFVNVDTSSLRRKPLKPEITKYDLDNNTRISLMWPGLDGGETSASPAHQHGSRQIDPNPQIVIKVMTEALELPGFANDYHIVLGEAHECLYKQRKSHPEVYELIERICLLDIVLVEQFSEEIFESYVSDQEKFYWIPAFKRLSTMYQREGRFTEALMISKRASAFNLSTDEELTILQALVNEL